MFNFFKEVDEFCYFMLYLKYSNNNKFVNIMGMSCIMMIFLIVYVVFKKEKCLRRLIWKYYCYVKFVFFDVLKLWFIVLNIYFN